jgi:hypothetical protein
LLIIRLNPPILRAIYDQQLPNFRHILGGNSVFGKSKDFLAPENSPKFGSSQQLAAAPIEA